MERNSKRIRVGDYGEDPIFTVEKKEIHENDHLSQYRTIRLQYREIETRINEEKDEIANVDSEKFMSMMKEVENMHQHVNNPREQVMDAQAFLGLSSTLVASVKTHVRGEISPAQFVSCLIREFGKQKWLSEGSAIVTWKSIGFRAAPVFMNAPGCKTMIGPMRNALKKLNSAVAKQLRSLSESTTAAKAYPQHAFFNYPYSFLGKRSAGPSSFSGKRSARPKARPQGCGMAVEAVSDTDRTIFVMFETLKKAKQVKVENLILNRNSFAQTVENLFALSFLVKDGRVCMDVDESGSQVVAPSNGPTAEQIKSGAVKNQQFIFRFDFDNWMLMKDIIPEGKELMPARLCMLQCSFRQSQSLRDKPCSQAETIPLGVPLGPAPVEKFKWNYGITIAKF